jgi:hypothetical protein
MGDSQKAADENTGNVIRGNCPEHVDASTVEGAKNDWKNSRGEDREREEDHSKLAFSGFLVRLASDIAPQRRGGREGRGEGGGK